MDRADNPAEIVFNDPDKSVLEAFMAYLAEGVGQGELTYRDVAMPGHLGVSVASGTLVFVPDPDVVRHLPAPTGGESVRVDFEHDGHRSWLLTEVQDLVSGSQWHLAPPRSLVLRSRRLAPRVRPGTDRAFRLRLRGSRVLGFGGRYTLEDISASGVAFLYWPHLSPLRIGQSLEGRLELPGGLDLMVGLELVSTRPAREGSMLQVAGTRFLAMCLEERLALAMSLSTWRERKGSTASGEIVAA